MDIEFSNLLKSPQEGDYGRKEKNRGDEPIWVIILIYMEMSQGNFLYIYLKKTKMSFLVFFFFFFYKIREQEGRIVLFRVLVPVGGVVCGERG
jgi:hypothetical protein